MKMKLNSVLLIDDNAATNLVHRKVLTKLGCAENIFVCKSGEEALNFLTSLSNSEAEDKQPQLVFLDINMPGMSGWDFMKEYERLPQETKGDVVIMMLTTSLNPDDKDRADQFHSISGFLNKPLSTSKLEQVLQQHF